MFACHSVIRRGGVPDRGRGLIGRGILDRGGDLIEGEGGGSLIEAGGQIEWEDEWA